MPLLSQQQADHMLRFAWQLREKTPDAATAIVKRVVDHHPKRADAWHVFGLILAQRNESAKAVTVLKRSLALDADNLDVRVALAEILIDLLDYKGALRELKVCFEKDPAMRHPSGVRARVVVVRMQKEIKRRLQS
jgi:predicted Zn-dependent protease